MRQISTGIELTTDAVADAVLTSATVLARAGTADSVTIPIVLDDGTVDEARLLVGPASQLTVVPDDAADSDLPTADDVVDDLRQRIVRLRPTSILIEPDDRAAADEFED